MNDWLPLAVAMLGTGVIGGVLAGLLGIGGGIVIVPVLDAVLGALGVDSAIRMHVAVATSLATIIPTSISSSRAHYRRRARVDVALVRRWAVFVFVGSLLGAWLRRKRAWVRVVDRLCEYGACSSRLKLILPFEDRDLSVGGSCKGPLMSLVPTAIGTVSSMMGIGGGTLSVAALTLCNQPIHRAVGTAALFGLVISLPGTVGFMIAGWGDPRLPPGKPRVRQRDWFRAYRADDGVVRPTGGRHCAQALPTPAFCFVWCVSDRHVGSHVLECRVFMTVIAALFGAVALLLVVLGIGAVMSLDLRHSHAAETARLGTFDERSSDGLTRIAANGWEFRARVVNAGGDGDGVLLLHGFPQTSAAWEPVLDACSKAGLFAVALDQRGYSPAARPRKKADYSLDKLIQDVLAVADAVGLKRFHLAGHDWGAAVAWGLAMQCPERVISLTALSVPHSYAFGAAVRTDPDQRRRSRYFLLFRTPILAELMLGFSVGLKILRTIMYQHMPAGTCALNTSAYFSEPGALTGCIKLVSSRRAGWYRKI